MTADLTVVPSLHEEGAGGTKDHCYRSWRQSAASKNIYQETNGGKSGRKSCKSNKDDCSLERIGPSGI